MAGSITTMTGDGGESGLLGGAREKKTDVRFEALGALDELGAALGFAKALAARVELKLSLEELQKNLVTLAGEVATRKEDFGRFADKFLGAEAPEGLRQKILELEEGRKFEKFELPGTSQLNAALHLARTIARRAERECWRVREAGGLARELPCVYLNRLSDLLWLMAEGKYE